MEKNKSDNTIKKEIIFLIIVSLIFITIHLSSLNQTIFNDEYFPKKLFIENQENNSPLKIFLAGGTGHPPINILPSIFLASFLGTDNWVFRISSLLFSIGIMILIYFITKKVYNSITAKIAVVLFILSDWYFIFSTQIHLDAPFLNFFVLLGLYFFIQYREKEKVVFLIFTGVIFGLCILTKFTGILLIPILFAYYIIYEADPIKRNKNTANKENIFTSSDKIKFKYFFSKKFILKTIKIFLTIGVIGSLVFSPYMILSIQHPEIQTTFSMLHAINNTYLSGNIFSNLSLLLIQYFLALVLLSPMFIVFYVLSFKKWKENIFFLIWSIIIFCFYTFLFKDYARSLERYLLLMFIPMIILSAKQISQITFKKKHIILIIILSIILFSSFIYINNTSKIIPFYPKQAYIEKIFNLSWDIKVPITGNAGPIGFYIGLFIIISSFIITAILLICIIINSIINKRKKNKIYILLIIFIISIGISYNLTIILENTTYLTSPNIDKANKNIIQYALEENSNLPSPIYIFRNCGITTYIGNKYKNITCLDFQDDNINTIKKIVIKGTLLIIDFPKTNYLYNESSYTDCNKTYEYFDKEYSLAKVIVCE
jgi:hypothetical protein